ncbi:DUF1850 domain-containing protein [Nitratireductor sp. CH_MIT9313-5]|uniref:DUF1850 domain-containing protein n=1 Tax=Nitratireductor sp. CH_MIT9313-5 TaxID=3107764 RepID=UPI0030094F66
MSLCIAAAGKLMMLAGTAFTLSWTHSVEKIEWRENWLIEKGALHLVQARVKGSGAGMEPPADARFEEGWWVYEPELAAQPQIVLAASGATGQGWQICMEEGACREIGRAASSPLTLRACTSEEKAN